jgi:hypothetical protein
VPDVTKINSDVLPELNGALRLGASSLPSVGFPGTSVPAAGPCAFIVDALPRVRGKVAVMVPQAQKVAVTAALGQTNLHNYMTGASAVGEGASGPPPYREPV